MEHLLKAGKLLHRQVFCYHLESRKYKEHFTQLSNQINNKSVKGMKVSCLWKLSLLVMLSSWACSSLRTALASFWQHRQVEYPGLCLYLSAMDDLHTKCKRKISHTELGWIIIETRENFGSALGWWMQQSCRGNDDWIVQIPSINYYDNVLLLQSTCVGLT